MRQMQLLDYRRPQTANPVPKAWIISVVLGIVQFPWAFYWTLTFIDARSLLPVRIMQDSMYWVLALALKFPALGTSAFCLHQARPASHVRVLITCSIVMAGSALLLAGVVYDWYSSDYIHQNGVYPFW